MRHSDCPNCNAPLWIADELPHDDDEHVEVLVHEEDISPGRGDALIGVFGGAVSGSITTLIFIWLIGLGC